VAGRCLGGNKHDASAFSAAVLSGVLFPAERRRTVIKRVRAREGSVHPPPVLPRTVRLRVLSRLGREHFVPQWRAFLYSVAGGRPREKLRTARGEARIRVLVRPGGSSALPCLSPKNAAAAAPPSLSPPGSGTAASRRRASAFRRGEIPASASSSTPRRQAAAQRRCLPRRPPLSSSSCSSSSSPSSSSCSSPPAGGRGGAVSRRGRPLSGRQRGAGALPSGVLSLGAWRRTIVKLVHAREGSVHAPRVLPRAVRLRVLSRPGREHFVPQRRPRNNGSSLDGGPAALSSPPQADALLLLLLLPLVAAGRSAGAGRGGALTVRASLPAVAPAPSRAKNQHFYSTPLVAARWR
jgi:hypothetical protein